MRVLAAVLAALLAGCAGPAPRAQPATLPRPSLSPLEVASSRAQPATLPRSSSKSLPVAPSHRVTSTGWTITVYYTAVERFHHGAPERVTGCPVLDCRNGHADLGTFPGDFVRAVHDEGTGRTADGRYLNWSYDVGYWLDTAPRDSAGGRLQPFVSAAADPGVLARGTTFTVIGCGRQDDGSPPARAVCAALRGANWRVTDEFTPGLGGRRHIDAYLGPETGPGFTGSPWFVTVSGASLALG